MPKVPPSVGKLEPEHGKPAFVRPPKFGDKGFGRPPGSKSRFNKNLLDQMEAEGLENPAMILLRWANDGCMPIDVRLEAAGKALPYFAQKQPTAVHVTGQLGATVSYEMPDNGRGDAPAPGPVASSHEEDHSAHGAAA